MSSWKLFATLPLLFVFDVCKALPKVDIVINEVNFMSPNQRDRREFVELKIVNRKATNMNYHRLIIIDTLGGNFSGKLVASFCLADFLEADF